jgi:hypothetical protein
MQARAEPTAMQKPAPTAVSSFFLGVTGHRDLAGADMPRIRGAVTALLQQLQERMPDTELCLMVGLAAGADLLVTEAALDAGVQVEALLPMPLAEYATDFPPAELARMQALLGHPGVRVLQLAMPAPLPEGGDEQPRARRDRCYTRLSETLMRRSSLLLALWDGSPSLLAAGTADTVLRFLGVRSDGKRDGAPLHFATPEPAAEPDPAERMVYWIPTPREGAGGISGGGEPCWLRGLGGDSLEMRLDMPEQLATPLRLLDHYNRDYRTLEAGGRLGRPDSLLAALPAGTPIDDDPALAGIDAQYAKADSLAVYFQRRSDRLFQLFAIMAFGMGLAYLIYEKLTDSRLLLFFYLVVLLGSLGLYGFLERRRWFAKHLTYRALAETLRVKFYLRLGGVDQRVDALEVFSLSGIDRFHGFSWVAFVLAGLQPPDTARAPGSEADAARRAGCVRSSWIDNQYSYFSRKVAQLGRSSRRVHRLRTGLFVLILVVIAVLFLFGQQLHHVDLGIGVPVHNLLTFCVGFFAVLLAVWELHQNKMATRELLWQYRNQLTHYGRARERLAGGGAGARRDAVLVELGKDSLMESYLWTIHRYHREHEPPAAT